MRGRQWEAKQANAYISEPNTQGSKSLESLGTRKVLRAKVADAGRQGRNSSRWGKSVARGARIQTATTGLWRWSWLEWILYQVPDEITGSELSWSSPGTGEDEGPSLGRESKFLYQFVLFWPSTDWRLPTCIEEGKLLYSVPWLKCWSSPEIPSQTHPK